MEGKQHQLSEKEYQKMTSERLHCISNTSNLLGEAKELDMSGITTNADLLENIGSWMKKSIAKIEDILTGRQKEVSVFQDGFSSFLTGVQVKTFEAMLKRMEEEKINSILLRFQQLDESVTRGLSSVE
eukprot:749370-Hanusia_phi.AAC.1